VNVSIVNWTKGLANQAILDGSEVGEITAALRPASSDVSAAERLQANSGRCFYGPIPSGRGFVLRLEEAEKLLADEPRYRDVIRPFLGGEDISNDPLQAPRRYVIDFGLRSLEEAMEYPRALEVVRMLVKPERDKTRRRAYRERWWRFAEPLVEMRRAVEPLPRYVGGDGDGEAHSLHLVRPMVVSQQRNECLRIQ
jgi:hypothetical protein